MKKTPSNLIEPKQGEKIYEPWMDYKDQSRPSTITSAPTITTPEAVGSRYRFSDAYAETASTTTDNSNISSFVPRKAVQTKAANQAGALAPRSAVRGRTAKQFGEVCNANDPMRSSKTPMSRSRNFLSRKSSSQSTSRERITSKQSIRSIREKPPPETLSSTTLEQSVSKRHVHSSPPPAYTANPDYTKDKKLIAQIEVEFSAFYSWTTNGSEEDLNQEIIKKLLFPKH